MSAADDLTVLEHSRVSPSPGGSVGTISLPLSYFDIPWLFLHPIHQLCFYELPQCSKSQFTQTIVPNLKHSLSITLHHFYPFAGNMIVFPFIDDSTTIPRKPEIRYVEGDSVSLTISECTKDFSYLTGHHGRKANEFYPLVPKLGDITKSSDFMKVSLLAVQVTLFPNNGICIGITNHHAACDGNARVSFIRAWASITKSGNDAEFLASGSIPFFDRSVIEDPLGKDIVLWNHLAKSRIQESPPRNVSGNDDKVRRSFIITRAEINEVKKMVMGRRPGIKHVSAFTIVCAHVWTCLSKLRDEIGESKGEDREVFGCVADCRSRLDPPVPTNYFGNCLAACTAFATANQLLSEGGLLDAIECIGDAIRERLKSKESIYQGMDIYLEDSASFPTTSFAVSGSPKFDLYETDFGWGKPKKCEIVSIDYGRTMSLSVRRESKEDLEIGLSLPKIQMDVFETIFTNELKSYLPWIHES